MARQYLLGNEAIAHAALEGGVGFVAGYPGTPSSEVIDLLRAERPEGVHVEWSTGQKSSARQAISANAKSTPTPARESRLRDRRSAL